MTVATAAPPPALPPALPPQSLNPLTSRQSFRAESVSPARHASPSFRRFSHSRGRPAASFAGTSRERSESVVSSERSEGSRAPLWRNREGVAEGGPAKDEAAATLLERLPSVLAHFLGHRPEPPAFASPILPFLRYLSIENEFLLVTFIGSLTSILLICGVSMGLSHHFTELSLAIGSFGATAVLLHAVPDGALSQPRSFVGGHIISALVGMVVSALFSLSSTFIPDETANPHQFQHLMPVVAALSVALSILLMQLTKTVHPPGGATALLAGFHPRRISFLVLVVCSVGVMLMWTLVIGNIGRKRYPVYWWKPVAVKPAAMTERRPSVFDMENRLGSVGEEMEERPEEEVFEDERRGRSSRARRLA